MGKKKKHRNEHGGEHCGAAMPLAGIATMVAAQVNSPAGRQAIAAGLRMAADALAGPRAGSGAGKPSRPAPPPPPAAPVADVPPEAPHPDTPPPPPRADVPPEVARVIGSVAAGLERWATKMGTPRG